MSIIKLLTSSVGRKILMAITGLSLSLFMAFHLFGNLFLFVGEAAFNGYVEKLHKLGFLIRIAEFFLVLFVFSHAYSGILLWLKTEKQKKLLVLIAKKIPQEPPSRRPLLEVLFLSF